MAYRSTGPESDAFLQALSELYKVKTSPKKFSSEVYADAVVLEGRLSTMETKPLKIKVFFNAEGPESKYAELYTNVDPSKRVLEIHEKDEGYRENVLRAFAQ